MTPIEKIRQGLVEGRIELIAEGYEILAGESIPIDHWGTVASHNTQLDKLAEIASLLQQALGKDEAEPIVKTTVKTKGKSKGKQTKTTKSVKTDKTKTVSESVETTPQAIMAAASNMAPPKRGKMQSGPVSGANAPMFDVGAALVEQGLAEQNEEVKGRLTRDPPKPRPFTCQKCGHEFDINKAYPGGLATPGIISCPQMKCRHKHINEKLLGSTR